MRSYQDILGRWYREYLSFNYLELQEKEKFFKQMGKQVWLNSYNACNGSWILTVMVA